MQPPGNAGSHYNNYKHTHYIILMAIAGPSYECLYADIGTNGRTSNGGVWNKCGMSKAIEDGSLSLPPRKCLPMGVTKVPYVFVGDDAFALKPYLMKPYLEHGLDLEKRVYNYRYSHARRLSENLFGILTNRWRVFRTVLTLPPKSIKILVLTALTLHNYLMQNSSSCTYCPTGLCDREIAGGTTAQGSWRQDIPSESFLPLQVPPRGHNSSTDVKMVRETFKDFFFHEGAVTWQWDKC